MSRRVFARPDSKVQERASRSLRETMRERATRQCESWKGGVRCVGEKGHGVSHWGWVLDRMMRWED